MFLLEVTHSTVWPIYKLWKGEGRYHGLRDQGGQSKAWAVEEERRWRTRFWFAWPEIQSGKKLLKCSVDFLGSSAEDLLLAWRVRKPDMKLPWLTLLFQLFAWVLSAKGAALNSMEEEEALVGWALVGRAEASVRGVSLSGGDKKDGKGSLSGLTWPDLTWSVSPQAFRPLLGLQSPIHPFSKLRCFYSRAF